MKKLRIRLTILNSLKITQNMGRKFNIKTRFREKILENLESFIIIKKKDAEALP